MVWPGEISAAASGNSTKPSAHDRPETRPDPSEAKTSTAPSRRRARKYSRRPAFFDFENAAGRCSACGDWNPAPASCNKAGRAKINVHTKAATGLPGRPKPALRPKRPKPKVALASQQSARAPCRHWRAIPQTCDPHLPRWPRQRL